MPELREEFRCVTVFEDFDVYEHYSSRTIRDHTSYSMARSSLGEAKWDLDAHVRLSESGRIRPIKRQHIEHRYITNWELTA